MTPSVLPGKNFFPKREIPMIPPKAPKAEKTIAETKIPIKNAGTDA
jgi:hypothetical protein